ncbi:MAG: Smr/MutS family protein [Spirochaetaceae bacterium]|jgi:DNA-nicking Smr family endonuclease|nr:Smr/MutS family protein [Spirochaetaceae bacterium]
MDFGDILHQWETGGYSQKKSVPGVQDEESASKVNPMDLWLRRYGAVDKDSLAQEEAGLSREEAFAERQRVRRMRPQATCDLHGLTRDEALQKLEDFTSDCIRREVQKAMIVHGKGNHSGTEPVLGDVVRSFIEKHPRLGEHGHPSARDGGSGATWVIFKS